MNLHLRNQLCLAIRERKLVQFLYDGHLRVVEPYTVGDQHNGNEALSAWWVEGFSHSGQTPEWRLYRLDEIRELTITDRRFTVNRSGYNPRDSRMARIHCCI